MQKLALPLAGILLALSGCSKDNEENQVVTPPPACTTANMSFTADVLPIISSNCGGCHGASPTAPFSLTNYTEIKAKADNGQLIGAITHAAGFSPMPKGGAKLSDCNISKIQAWIAQGTKDN